MSLRPAFSQTSSQYCEVPAGEISGPPTTKLTIRASSPVPALPNTNTTTIYPALALQRPSLLPHLIHSFHDPVHNPSQSLHSFHGPTHNPSQSLHSGTYVGDVEAAQRYMQNILWLKNQIDHGPDRPVNQWQQRRGRNSTGSETRITGRELRSPDSAYRHPITSERRPIRRAKKCLWPRYVNDPLNSISAGEDVGRRKFKLRKTRDSALLLNCEKMRAIQNNNSPCNSPSEDNSITDDSGCSVSLLPVKCQRSPRVNLTLRKTRMIENGESPPFEPLSQQICKPQVISRPQGCLICPSWPLMRGRDFKSRTARSPSEDAASSLEMDSVGSSERVSVHRNTRTNGNSSAESDYQPRQPSPQGRPTRRGSGARDARTWDKIERKPQKMSCHATTTKFESSVQPECAFEVDSESKDEEQGPGDRHNNMPDDKSCLQGMCMEETERDDTNKQPREQRSESPTRPIAEVETSRKPIVTEHAEKAWNPSFESNRGHRHILVEHDRVGTYESKCESLHEDPQCNFSPRTAENKTGDYSSHNRLREAVEAAWNTNLGTTRGFGDYCINVSSGHKCTDQAFPSEILHGDSKANTLLPFAEGTAHSCLWKVRSGIEKGVAEDCRIKSPANPIFQNVYIDQENLRAPVAREECPQRELKDRTVARVTAEERARVTAEEKAHIYEASAKAAEEGLRVLLDERALFHCKFKEELEKGATDRLRLQELLHLEKLKLESTESELKEVRRSFRDSVAVGGRALPSKNTLQDHRLDEPSVHALAPHGPGAGHDEARLQLMTESEKRIAAEAKASYFEASAKAAEERLRSLLDERNWFYSRFKEELEQNNTDLKKLQQLIELEKFNVGLTDQQLKTKVDARPPVGLGLAKRNLDIKTEGGQRAGVHFRTAFCSRLDEELVPGDKDRHRMGPSEEFEEPPDEQSHFPFPCDTEISDYKQAEDCFGEDRKSTSSIDMSENRDVRYMRATSNDKSSMTNEKKRPLSPAFTSRVLHWKSADGPVSVKVDRFNGRDGETATVLDVSPLGSRLDSIDLYFGENPESPHNSRFAADQSLGFKQNAFDFRKSAGLALENCAQRSHVNAGQPMTLPSKWKKDTKVELRRMIQEQEKTWKIAEDAVEELGRRLELLERYKMEIQDTLGRTRAVGNIDRFFKRLQENLGDCPRGFNSLYNSPIYEEGKALYKCPIFTEKKRGRPPCQDVCTSPTRPGFSKDSEIEKLKVEVAQLRVRLQQQDRKRPDSSKLKLSSRSPPPSPRLPTSRPLVADTEWSAHLISGLETPVTKEDIPQLHLISQRNPTTPQVIPEKMEPELADNSLEEMKSITMHARENGSKQHSNEDVERFESSGNLSSRRKELDAHDRGWVPTSDESLDKSAAPIFMENETGQMEPLDYPERSTPQEDILVSIDLNSEEGELQVLKTAVRKLACLFWEQEEKLKLFAPRYKMEDANYSQAEDVKNLYLDMLKEMSQQLGELCLDLHAKTRSDKVLIKHKRITQQCYPLQSVQKFKHMETMDKPPGTSRDRIEYEDTSLFSTNKLKCEAKESVKGEEDQHENLMANSENLTIDLEAAEKKIQEEISTNEFLAEKLESGSQYLSKMQAEHAQGVARKDHSINCTQQLNFDLSSGISQTETSLAEIRLRYKGLVTTLEQQLEDVKKEAVSIQDAVNVLKNEIVRKENLILNLEAEAKEHKLQIEQLRSQIAGIQDDTTENIRAKLELLNSLEAMRREMDEQQRRVTELISVNEDLVAFSESKEDEVTGLKITIKDLQQRVDEKSAEAAKLSAEILTFSHEVFETRKEGETYRVRCTALKSKLEEIELELQAREASMERLTRHLGKTIEDQDFILEEKEQLLLSLNRAQYKEHRLGDQVRQSKTIIQDLEEKLNSMDAEINQTRLQMAEMKTKGLEALLIEQHAGVMRNRVHELEAEIVEKEGKISILKTSYPGEFTSTF